jgi:hypothetical protein
MSYRILVTGSRDWTDEDAISRAVIGWLTEHGWPFPVIVHGGARGADTLAHRFAARWGFVSERHPAGWEQYGRSAGHRRNAEMVALGADVCLAFPLGVSPGTRGCMRLAEAAGIQVVNCGEGRLIVSESAGATSDEADDCPACGSPNHDMCTRGDPVYWVTHCVGCGDFGHLSSFRCCENCEH